MKALQRGLMILAFGLALPLAGVAAEAPRPAQGFSSAEAGFTAMAAAIEKGDRAALRRILGDAGADLVRDRDAAEDSAARTRFNTAYAEQHAIRFPSPDRAELSIGPDDFPFAIPMRQRAGVWRFDARAGAEALAERRIGRNELDTIDALHAIVEAQAEYAAGAGRRGGLAAYAGRFFSSPGQRDGLYWPSAAGEPESPLGPYLAAAGVARGARGDQPEPFRGYLYRILTAQGPAAPGGAMDYRIGGRLVAGFAILATPAEYGQSGIQSFLVNQDGTIWQRDLGPETARIAAGITRYDPDRRWRKAED